MGDLNMPLDSPRTEDEGRDAEAWLAYAVTTRAATLPPSGPTRDPGRFGGRSTDAPAAMFEQHFAGHMK